MRLAAGQSDDLRVRLPAVVLDSLHGPDHPDRLATATGLVGRIYERSASRLRYPVPSPLGAADDNKLVLVTWPLTTADATGDAVAWAEWADRSVTFTGTWGGATAALEGSNDGTNWVPLADPQGGAISKSANAIEAVLELTRFVRAKLTTAGSGAVISATLLMRKA